MLGEGIRASHLPGLTGLVSFLSLCSWPAGLKLCEPRGFGEVAMEPRGSEQTECAILQAAVESVRASPAEAATVRLTSCLSSHLPQLQGSASLGPCYCSLLLRLQAACWGLPAFSEKLQRIKCVSDQPLRTLRRTPRSRLQPVAELSSQPEEAPGPGWGQVRPFPRTAVVFPATQARGSSQILASSIKFLFFQ